MQLVTYLDVLLGILKVFKESIVAPGNAGLFVGGTVRVPVGLSGLATKESVKVGTLLVSTTLFDVVTLTALGLEGLGALLFARFLGHGECSLVDIRNTLLCRESLLVPHKRLRVSLMPMHHEAS
jgi:hypothetical protein